MILSFNTCTEFYQGLDQEYYYSLIDHLGMVLYSLNIDEYIQTSPLHILVALHITFHKILPVPIFA